MSANRVSGYLVFAVCILLWGVLVLGLVINRLQQKLVIASQTCERVVKDPNVMELPPMYVEGKVPQGVVEL